MVTINKNNYGDIIVESNKKNNLPTLFNLNEKKIIIFKGFNMNPPKTVFLSNTKRYGTIYCSKFTKQIFPKVRDGNMYGANCVIFINKNNKIYTVLIKLNTNQFYTTPVGMCKQNELVKQTAERKSLEDTGLLVNNLKPLGFWSFNGKYGGLVWNKRISSFYGYAELPNNFNLNENINEIHLNDKKILIVDINYIDNVKNFDSGHYHHLVKGAIAKIRNNFDSFSINTFDYLKKFKFINNH